MPALVSEVLTALPAVWSVDPHTDGLTVFHLARLRGDGVVDEPTVRATSLAVMDEREDAELVELAAMLRERNALDARIGRLLDRPANTGHIGEWIAARIFDIELEEAANAVGYDGHFTTGALVGQTVNVKAYGKFESMLAINPNAPLDRWGL